MPQSWFANLFGLSPSSSKGKITGVALSGGGSRGAAHIGMLKALEEHDIYPEIIAGCSVGSIVGSLYAAGKSPEEMLEIFRKVRVFQFFNFTIRKPGLLDPDKYKMYLEDHLSDLTFETLPKKLRIVATGLLTGKQRVFSSGSVLEAVLASAAYPGVFAPVEIDGELFVDGGVLNILPSDLIRAECDRLICMDLNPDHSVDLRDIDSTLEVIRRVLEIMTRRQAESGTSQCDLCISSPEFEKYHIFKMEQVDELYELGYKLTTEMLEKPQV